MVGSNNIERTSSIKSLGVMLDEHIFWIDHVRTVEKYWKILVYSIA